jgi:hypothetical protein
MDVTPHHLLRGAAAAAVLAGALFIGVQIGHPPLDADTITTTGLAVRGTVKVLLAALALAGITGIYLRQVQEAGVLGLVGYVLLAVGYLSILGTAFASAFVLPAVADTVPAYVDDAMVAVTGGQPEGDIGLWLPVLRVQGVAYLVGGTLLGVALVRARVLVRWGSVVLAVSGLVTLALSAMPEGLYRFLAWPNGIALLALGVSLWRSVQPVGVAQLGTSPRR